MSGASLAAALLVLCALVLAGCTDSEGAAATPSARSRHRPTTTIPAAPSTSAASPSTASPTAPVRPSGIPDGWNPAPLDWRPCPDVAATATCADLEVPLDWSAPSGRPITLALARIPASGGPSTRLGSVVTDPGGPGGSGVAFVASSPFDATVASRFDQVSWDPRGVGRSTPVTCGRGTAERFLEADPDPDTSAEQSQLDDLARQVSSDCTSEKDLLAHISTADVARDLEAIRRALGDGPLNYVGFSYGTQIGETYAEMYPDRIRTMVLDGVVDPSLSFTEFLMGQIDGFDAAFGRNVERCAAAGAASCGVEDLASAYDRLHKQVESSPIPAGRGRTLGPADLAVAATYVSYSSAGWRRLGPALAAGLRGDGSRLAALADAYHDLGGYGVYAGVVCTDSPPPPTPMAWEQFANAARVRSPRFGGSIANELLPCATWPVPATGTPRRLSVAGAPPILVIGNTGDPATPLANAVSVAGQLASGVLVTADISGHTAYGSDGCVTRIVDSYLTDRTVPPAGTTC